MNAKNGVTGTRTVLAVGGIAALLLWTLFGAMFVPSELTAWALGRPANAEWERLAPAILAMVGQVLSSAPTRLGERLPVKHAALLCTALTIASLAAGALMGGVAGLILVTLVACLFGVAGLDLTLTALLRAVERSAHHRYGDADVHERMLRVDEATQKANGGLILAQGAALFLPGPIADAALHLTGVSDYLLGFAIVLALAMAVVWRWCPAPPRGIDRPSRGVDRRELRLAQIVSFASVFQLTAWDGFVRHAADDIGVSRTAVGWTQIAFLFGGVAALAFFTATKRDGTARFRPEGRLVAGALITTGSFAAAALLALLPDQETGRTSALLGGRVLVEAGTSLTTASILGLFATSVIAHSAITRARGAGLLIALIAGTWIWTEVAPVVRLFPLAGLAVLVGFFQIGAVLVWWFLRRGAGRRRERGEVADLVRGFGQVLVSPSTWDLPVEKVEGTEIAGTRAERPIPLTWADRRERWRYQRHDRIARHTSDLATEIANWLGRHALIGDVGAVRVWRRRNGGYAVFARIAMRGDMIQALAQIEAERLRAKYGLEAVFLGPIGPGEQRHVRGDRRVVMKSHRDKRVMHVITRPDRSCTIVYETRDHKPRLWLRSVVKAYRLKDAAARAGTNVDVLTTVAQVKPTGPTRRPTPIDPAELRKGIAACVDRLRLVERGARCAVTLFDGHEGPIAHVAVSPRSHDAADLLAQSAASAVATRFPSLAAVLVGAAV